MTLSDRQKSALRHLRDHGALPDSGYWRPIWMMQYEWAFDGRTFAGLVKKGLATRIEASDGRGAWQLTVDGYRALEAEGYCDD